MSDNGTTIEFIYTDFPDADAESALNCSYDALKFFRRLYKIAEEENTYIKFSLSASGTSGGYSRKNFITLNSGSFNEYILRNTAHEISHFWWNKAPVESWHDWLNESFAEFSALQYLRHARGEEAYAKRVEMYRERRAASVRSGGSTGPTAKRTPHFTRRDLSCWPTCSSGWARNPSSTSWRL